MKIGITVNGVRKTVEKNSSIYDFLSVKELDPDLVVVEHNLSIAGRENLEKIFLKENDTLEILRIVGGG